MFTNPYRFYALFTENFENSFPISTLIPSARARSANSPPPPTRASTITGTSTPISFRVITSENEKVAIGYLRVLKIFDNSGELVWDMSDAKIPKTKVIDGY